MKIQPTYGIQLTGAETTIISLNRNMDNVHYRGPLLGGINSNKNE